MLVKEKLKMLKKVVLWTLWHLHYKKVRPGTAKMSTGPCCYTMLMTDSSNQLQHIFPQSFGVASESFSIRLLKELRIKGKKTKGLGHWAQTVGGLASLMAWGGVSSLQVSCEDSGRQMCDSFCCFRQTFQVMLVSESQDKARTLQKLIHGSY